MATVAEMKTQVAKINEMAGESYEIGKGYDGTGYKIGNKYYRTKDAAVDSMGLIIQLFEHGDWDASNIKRTFG